MGSSNIQGFALRRAVLFAIGEKYHFTLQIVWRKISIKNENKYHHLFEANTTSLTLISSPNIRGFTMIRAVIKIPERRP